MIIELTRGLVTHVDPDDYLFLINWKRCAQITVNKKQISLGYFLDFNEACNIRKEAEIKYHGEFRYIGKN
jgi:hypothetical protein